MIYFAIVATNAQRPLLICLPCQPLPAIDYTTATSGWWLLSRLPMSDVSATHLYRHPCHRCFSNATSSVRRRPNCSGML